MSEGSDELNEVISIDSMSWITTVESSFLSWFSNPLSREIESKASYPTLAIQVQLQHTSESQPEPRSLSVGFSLARLPTRRKGFVDYNRPERRDTRKLEGKELPSSEEGDLLSFKKNQDTISSSI